MQRGCKPRSDNAIRCLVAILACMNTIPFYLCMESCADYVNSDSLVYSLVYVRFHDERESCQQPYIRTIPWRARVLSTALHTYDSMTSESCQQPYIRTIPWRARVLSTALHTYDSVTSDMLSCLQPYKKMEKKCIRTFLWRAAYSLIKFFYTYHCVKSDMQSCLTAL